MNIILVGFMGSGKSVVGKLLAKQLSMGYLDTDEIIEAKTGLTINQIFQRADEDKFRELESRIIKNIANNLDNTVISTGGGTVTREENILNLKSLGPIIWLITTPEVIYKRTRGLSHRPLLNVENPYELIHKLLRARHVYYESAADFSIDTSYRTPQEVVDICIKWLIEKKFIIPN